MNNLQAAHEQERFEAEVLLDPIVQQDESVRLAMSLYQNGDVTLLRTCLALVRALAHQKHAAWTRLAQIEGRQ